MTNTIMGELDEILNLTDNLEKYMLQPNILEQEAIKRGELADAEAKRLDCDHQCSGNCRRVGCNCKCGEWHNELDAVDVATNVAERDASEARTREEMRGEDLSDELRGK